MGGLAGCMAPPAVFEPVLSQLRSEASGLFGIRDAVLVPRRYEERPFSHVLRVAVHEREISQPASHAFVKIFKAFPHDGGVGKMATRVSHDFDTTSRIHAAMSRYADIGVVRPLACYVDQLAVVTEESPGVTLQVHLESEAAWRPSRAALGRLQDTMARVGRWVRAFQEIDRLDARVAPGELTGYLDLRLARLVGTRQAHFSQGDRERVLRHVESLLSSVSPESLREVLVHADLIPANVLVSTERVVVLDLAMTHRGTRLQDLARMHFQMDLMTAKPHFLVRTIRRLQQALLDGFEAGLTDRDPLFRLLLLMQRVNHLGSLAIRPAGFPASLYNRHVRRLHRRWLDRELRVAAGQSETR